MRMFLAIVVLLSAAVPAGAYSCAEPVAPACATDWTDFSTDDASLRCRREMEDYRSELEGFQLCLQGVARDALGRFNETVKRYNCKVQGRLCL